MSKSNLSAKPGLKWRFAFSLAACWLSTGIGIPGVADERPTMESMAQQDASKLAWKFKAGEKFDLLFDQLSQIDTSVLNRNVKIKARLKMQISWEIESVDERGIAKVKQTIHWATMKMTRTDPERGSNTIEIDSREEVDKDAPQRTKAIVKELLNDIKPVMGVSIHFKMNSRGRIYDFEVPDKTKVALRDASSSMELRKLFSSEGMGTLLGPAAIEFPEKAVEAGEKWERTRKLSNPMGAFNQTFTYQLDSASVDRPTDIATISVESVTQKTKDGSKKIEVISQAGIGSIKFDVDRGHMTTSNFVTQVETKESPRSDYDIVTKTRDEVILEIKRK